MAGNPKHEVLNPKEWHLTEYDLKKQSQFAGRLDERKQSVNKGICRGIRSMSARKQSQSPAYGGKSETDSLFTEPSAISVANRKMRNKANFGNDRIQNPEDRRQKRTERISGLATRSTLLRA